MKGLTAILREEVIEGTSSSVVFGRKEDEAREQRRIDVERLTSRLDAQARFNNRLIITIVASYLAILALIAVLVLLHQDTNWIAIALGGNLLALAGSVGFIRDVWREKNYIDMMLAVLPSLTNEEAMKMLRTFYFEKVAAKRGSRTEKAPVTTT